MIHSSNLENSFIIIKRGACVIVTQEYRIDTYTKGIILFWDKTRHKYISSYFGHNLDRMSGLADREFNMAKNIYWSKLNLKFAKNWNENIN